MLAAGRQTQTLPCGHMLHKRCVVKLRRRGASGRCPLCRAAHDDLTPLQELVDKAVAHYIQKSEAEAARLASEVLDLDPEHADMKGILGELHREGKGVPRDLDRARKQHAKEV